MANYFDQFDTPKSQPNFFDQFDPPPAASGADPWAAFPVVTADPKDPWAAFPAADAAPAAPPPAPVVPPKAPAADDLPVPGTLRMDGSTVGVDAPKPEPSLIDQIMGAAGYAGATMSNFLEGARNGAASTLGLPVDAINAAPMLANLIPGVSGVGPMSEKPLGGSAMLGDVLSGYGLVPDAPKPADAFQAGANRVGQEIGATAVPMLGTLGATARMTAAEARALPGVAKFFGADKAAVDPAKYVADELRVATGAGTGAAVVNGLTGNDRSTAGGQLLDAGGAIGGAGITGASTSLLKAAKNIGTAVFAPAKYVDDGVRGDVVDLIMGNVGTRPQSGAVDDTEPLVNMITKGRKVGDDVPGFQESLADRTKIPGIAALEYSRQSGPNAGMYNAQRGANTAAVDNAMKPFEPTETPGAFADAAFAERNKRLGEAAVKASDATKAWENSTRTLLPALTAEGRGANIRTALQDASDNAKAILQQAWAPINGSRQSVDMEALDAIFRGTDENLSMAERARFRPGEADIPAKLVGANDAGPAPVIPDDLVRKLAESRANPGVADARDFLASAKLPPSLQSRIDKATAGGEFDFHEWQNVMDAAVMLQRNGALDSRVVDALATLESTYMHGKGADAVDALMPKVRADLEQNVAEIRGLDPNSTWTPETWSAGGMTDQDIAESAFGIAKTAGPMPKSTATPMQPLNEITGIRSALTDAAREATTAGKTNEARVIGQYIDGIDSYMQNNLPDDLRQQYDTARTATVDFNDRFTRPQTAIGQTLSEREGMPRYPDSTVANKFVQGDQGRIADFESLMREAGSDDRVQTAVRDQILQDVKDRGLLEKPDALQSYLDGYGKVFAKFPALKAQLGDAKNLRAEMDTATTASTELTDQLTKQGKSAVANYLQYGNENADRAMRGVLGAKDPKKAIDELLTFVGDDAKAVEGARKTFWDIMQKDARSGGRTTGDINGAQPWSPYSLNKFLDDPVNSSVLERLYRSNPEHLANIREIAKAIQGTEVRNGAKAANSSGTAQGINNVLTPETVQSRLYAYKSGKISLSFLITAMVSVIARRSVGAARDQSFNRILDDALLDPEAAALLLKKNNPANRAALGRLAKNWFGNEASTVINAMSGEGDDEDVNTIMGSR